MEDIIRVIVVEDDDDMRTTLVRYLVRAGMTVDGYPDAAKIDEVPQDELPQIMILDVNLPGESGFVAAARLRARSTIGIVMLTGRSGRDDRLLGLSMGVDHYLTKPVDLIELESIVRNLARRLKSPNGHYAPPAAAVDRDLPAGWTLDSASWHLTSPNGTGVDLSAAEYSLLLPLLEQPGQPGSRHVINTRLGKPRLDADNRSLDVLVSRVKRKVKTATGTELPLRSARGAGYVFTGPALVTSAPGA